MSDKPARRAASATRPERRRKTLVLSAEAIQRLEHAAVKEECDESRIVESLINAHLSGYVLQVRGPRLVIPKDRLKAAADASPDAEVAA